MTQSSMKRYGLGVQSWGAGCRLHLTFPHAFKEEKKEKREISAPTLHPAPGSAEAAQLVSR